MRVRILRTPEARSKETAPPIPWYAWLGLAIAVGVPLGFGILALVRV